MRPEALAELRELLAKGAIDEAQFRLISGGVDPSVQVSGSGAVAQGDRAQAIGAGSIGVGRDNYGQVHNGDVHHHGSTNPGSAQPASLRRDYLRRVWRHTNTLSLLAGGDTQKPVRLGAVYTALMTELGSGFKLPNDPAKRAASQARALEPGESEPPLSAVAVLDQEPRLVLLGSPGSGKSTFVHYVTQCMAGELLGVQAEAPEPNLQTLTCPLPRDGEKPLGHEQGGEPPRPEPWRHGALLPVLVILRDLAAQLPPPGQPVGADTAWSYLVRGLESAALAEFAPLLKAELHDHGGLVMFDGLDEVPEGEQRRKQIQQVVQDFAAGFSRCRILVTSRTYAYQHQDWKLPGFAEAPLNPFTVGQIRAFVQSWYRHMSELSRLTPEDAQGRAALLLRQVEVNPRVAELAQRPLLLTLFARLQTERGGELPEQREELYYAAVEMLLNDWEKAKLRHRDGGPPLLEPSLSEWLKASRTDMRAQLDRLAFEAHRDQQALQGTADIRQSQLIDALLRASAGRADVQPLRLQEYLRDRAGILVEHGVGMLQFPHRTFQEYLAACHLANDSFPEQVAALVREDPTRWREVALLAGTHAARGNKGLPTWALVDELCPEDLPPDPDAPDSWGALLAGQVLVASSEHVEPPRRNRPSLERVRRAQLTLLRTTSLPAIKRALVGRTLASLGDTRPEVMTLAGMQFCWVPPGPFEMGGNDFGSAARPRHTVDLRYGYFVGRYPVTRAQWKQYLHDSGHRTYDDDGVDGADNEPVTRVTWHDTQRFCTYLSTAWRHALPPGWRACLPSEAEWEKAARGGQGLPGQRRAAIGWVDLATAACFAAVSMANPQPGRAWPWGHEFDADRANTVQARIGQVSAVGAFAQGGSPYGCEEMAGNVWEWTRSLWGMDHFKCQFAYPFDPDDPARNDEAAADQVWRLVRGGAWNVIGDAARCAARNGRRPDGRNDKLGFRVVLRCAPVARS